MTNTKELLDIIEKSGFKKSYIANKIGLTTASFRRKIINKAEFKASEIVGICRLLGITDTKTKERIFFATKVD